MEIVVEVENVAAGAYYRIPKPNLAQFQQLFADWGTDANALQALRIHITFCRTECAGEYLGYRDGIHRMELKDLYLLVGVPQHFLEKITIHELRHVWWALQKNPPADLGEDDCRKVAERPASGLLWSLENPAG